MLYIINKKTQEELASKDKVHTLSIYIICSTHVRPTWITFRAVVSGGAGCAVAPPEFRSSVKPIPTRGGIFCPPHYC